MSNTGEPIRSVSVTCPAPLTNQIWQTKKGIIGTTKKTGIGESLQALQKAFGQTHFASLDAAKMIGDLTDPPVFQRNSEKLRAVLDVQAGPLSGGFRRAVVTRPAASAGNPPP